MSKVFRAYECDEHNKFIKAHIVEAETDDDAIDQSRSLLDGHEVWEGARLIGRLPHKE